MANDSILTRAEVEHERKSLAELDRKFGGDMKVDCFVSKQSELLNTITKERDALREWARQMVGYHTTGCHHCSDVGCDICEKWLDDQINKWRKLLTTSGEAGKGGESVQLSNRNIAAMQELPKYSKGGGA